MEKLLSFFKEEKLLFLIKGGVYLLFLTPLILCPFTTFPTLFPRVIYFRIIGEIIFALYLILLIKNRRYLPKVSLLSICLLVFVEVSLFSLLKGINPYRSFWGTMERMTSFFDTLHLFAFFIVCISIFKEKTEWLKAIKFIVYSSFLVAIAGLIQKLGLFTFYDSNYTAGKGILGQFFFNRVSATFGNSMVLASYLILVIFLALFLFIQEEERRPKILLGFSIFLNSFILVLSGTRAAWVGICLGALFIFISSFVTIFKKRKTRLIMLSGLLVPLILFLGLLFLWTNGHLKNNGLMTRYETIFSNILDFNNQRVFVWRLGLKAVKDSPIIGFGQESFSYLYAKYYTADLAQYIPETTFFDRSHNFIIDLLIQTGVIGLISYLAIFVVATIMLIKQKLPGFILIGLFIAYFFSNLFGFETTPANIFIFFLLALIASVYGKNKDEAVKEFKIPAWLRIVLSLLVFGLIGSTIFFFNIKPLIASNQLASAEQLAHKGELEKATSLYSRAIAYPGFTQVENNFYSIAMLLNYANAYLDQGQKSLNQELVVKSLLKTVQATEDYFNDNSGQEIRELESYLLVAQAYRTLYFSTKEVKYLGDEERMLGKAITFNPEIVRSYRLAGEARILQGKEEEGMIFLQKAYSLDHDLLAFYEILGVSLVEAGQKERGANYLRKNMRLGDFYSENRFDMTVVWRIADYYSNAGNYRELASFYEEVLRLYPKTQKVNPQLYASLATVYVKLGEKEKALIVVNKMFEDYPGLKGQSQEFLKALENVKND